MLNWSRFLFIRKPNLSSIHVRNSIKTNNTNSKPSSNHTSKNLPFFSLESAAENTEPKVYKSNLFDKPFWEKSTEPNSPPIEEDEDAYEYNQSETSSHNFTQYANDDSWHSEPPDEQYDTIMDYDNIERLGGSLKKSPSISKEDSTFAPSIMEIVGEENNENYPKPPKLFVDRLQLTIRSGNGGSVPKYRKRRKIPKGPGYGGHGGHIYLRANVNVDSLSGLPTDEINAPNGGNGGDPSFRDGTSRGLHGRHIIVDVPIGTIVRQYVRQKGAKTDDGSPVFHWKFVYQFLYHNQRVLFCKGGKGGLGHSKIKLNDGRKPSFGEKKIIDLEYRVVCDAALIGSVNSGKSSLMAAMTRQFSRIGPEPFSTSRPYLGAIAYRDGINILVADLPPIFTNAHLDAEKGLKILNHSWRAKVLVYIIDLSDESFDPVEEFWKLHREMSDFDPIWFKHRKFVIIGTKMDKVHRDTLFKLDSLYYRLFHYFCIQNDGDPIKVVGTSAKYGLGIKNAVDAIRQSLYPDALIPSYRERAEQVRQTPSKFPDQQMIEEMQKRFLQKTSADFSLLTE